MVVGYYCISFVSWTRPGRTLVRPDLLWYPILYPFLRVSGTVSLGGKRLELKCISFITNVNSIYKFTNVLLNTFKLGVYTKGHSEFSILLLLMHVVS